MTSSAIATRRRGCGGRSLDGKGVQIDEYKDNPSNRRPSGDDGPQTDTKAFAEEPMQQSRKTAE